MHFTLYNHALLQFKMLNYFIIFFIFIILIYLWFKKCFSYWRSVGLVGPKPIIPFGNIWPTIKGDVHGLLHFNSFYDNYKDRKLIGLYVFHVPIVIFNDIELINRVLSTDYCYFNSHHFTINLERDPLNAHLFAASGENWKVMRAKLNPAFSTGKIKKVYQYMEKNSLNLVKYLNNEVELNKCLEFSDIFARYTIDVIANAAFGFDSNCFQDDNSPFRYYGKRINNDTFLESIKTMLTLIAPSLAESLNIVHAKPDVKKFFTKLVTEAVEYREKNQIKRDDFLGLLIDLKNNTFTDDSGKLLNLSTRGRISLEELIAQVYVFFFAGYETSSIVGSTALFLMAKYPETQKKAREEVERVLQKYNGEFSFEAINDMTYLSGVFYETMRMFPPLPTLFRKCLIDYKVPDTDVTIKKGTMVYIPAYAIHHDPQYFEDPYTFDPDRFSVDRKPENLNKIYFPYGQGPRTCIGIRIGQLQIKLALAKLLKIYDFKLPDNMKGPINFEPKNLTLNIAGGVHLKLKPL